MVTLHQLRQRIEAAEQLAQVSGPDWLMFEEHGPDRRLSLVRDSGIALEQGARETLEAFMKRCGATECFTVFDASEPVPYGFHHAPPGGRSLD